MRELAAQELRRLCDPASFGFKTTAELDPYVGLIGQDRAMEALSLGLEIESNGFDICVTGEPGTGRSTAVREFLERYAGAKAPAPDWCYVFDFADAYRPKALQLPASRGRALKSAMNQMLEAAKERIPEAFRTDVVGKRRDEILHEAQRHHETAYSELAAKAAPQGFQLQGGPAGFFLMPMSGGQPLSDQAFAALAPEQREQLLRTRDVLLEELREVTKQETAEDEAASRKLLDLETSVATDVVDSLLHAVFDQFEDSPEVIGYLAEVRRSMIDHIEDFQPRPPATPTPFPIAPMHDPAALLRKYEVNLLSDVSDNGHAPVVFETNPSPQRLFGRIEKESYFGTVSTDFTMIRGGSLHRANGGYLVLDFDDVLLYPLSWIELKRMLRTRELTVEEMGDRLGYLEVKSLRPHPVPWTGKVILLARESVYRMLYEADPDFRDLFKVKADFDSHIDRTPVHEESFAQLIAGVVQREKLLPFDNIAVARIVDEAARTANDQNKLSIRFSELTDVVREATYWARHAGADTVTLEHVKKALEGRVHRANLIEEHMRKTVAEGIIVFDVKEGAVGQVNGLSVIDIGDASFGQPARITASIGVGREGIVDLQRAVELAGPIHSKAVLTLRGFLLDRYARSQPLSLSASLAFEQSYGLVEGDSATCAEVCALLSVLGDVPLKQSLAITGSMDQRGRVQAVGGLNEKLEGFFDICRLQGLTGEQGVIIPASNAQHLMLREDLIEAVKENRFHIFTVTTIDEALSVLTGMDAGTRNEFGHYPECSVNGRVEARLAQLATHLREQALPTGELV